MLGRSEGIDDLEYLKELNEEGIEPRGVLAPQKRQIGRVENSAFHKRILRRKGKEKEYEKMKKRNENGFVL